jgi:hypothetical protein
MWSTFSKLAISLSSVTARQPRCEDLYVSFDRIELVLGAAFERIDLYQRRVKFLGCLGGSELTR